MKDKKMEIAKLEKEKIEISKKIHALEKEIMEANYKKLYDERRKYIGKCYQVLPEAKSVAYPNIVGFEILDIDNNPDSFLCKTIINSRGRSTSETFGVLKQMIYLFSPDIQRKMYDENDPKTIDLFKEISKEEFDNMVNVVIEQL